MNLEERLSKTLFEMSEEQYENLAIQARQFIKDAFCRGEPWPTSLWQLPKNSLLRKNLVDAWSITIEQPKFRVRVRNFYEPQIFDGDRLDMRFVPEPEIIWI